jgi:THO complex subunit 4
VLTLHCSKPKSAAKEVTKGKTNSAAATNGASKAKATGKKPARNSRPKKKTAEELDAEMMDYFGNGENAANGAAQPAAAAANGGDAMVDEVL